MSATLYDCYTSLHMHSEVHGSEQGFHPITLTLTQLSFVIAIKLITHFASQRVLMLVNSDEALMLVHTLKHLLLAISVHVSENNYYTCIYLFRV